MDIFQDRADIETGPYIWASALGPRQIEPLLNELEPHVPYSLPLIRRLQFHLHQPISPTARVFVAVVVASGAEEPQPSPADNNDRAGGAGGLDGGRLAMRRPSAPFIAAHVDLAHAGQTNVWIFGSWESDPPHTNPSSLPTAAATLPSTQPVHRSLMRGVCKYIANELIPLMPTTPPDEWLGLERTGKYLSKPYSRDKVLFGAVSERLWGLFPAEARTRTDDGYWKYLLRVGSVASNTGTDGAGGAGVVPDVPLPEGYSFGEMRDRHLQAVLDRTPVPRTLSTLRQLVSVGLFHEAARDPIGWGFLGKDASLSSLHTEPEHRGKGLAVALGAELLKQQDLFVSAERLSNGGGGGVRAVNGAGEHSAKGSDTWAHADVSKDNKASQRVMEKLGGTPTWTVMWTEVDMPKLLALL